MKIYSVSNKGIAGKEYYQFQSQYSYKRDSYKMNGACTSQRIIHAGQVIYKWQITDRATFRSASV